MPRLVSHLLEPAPAAGEHQRGFHERTSEHPGPHTLFERDTVFGRTGTGA